MIDWHHLFGLTLADFFLNSEYTVDIEKELPVKQRIDIVIIREGKGRKIEEFPDGLDNLREHNLITYKSLRQPLTSWSIDELVGHYVNYRKAVSSKYLLLPVDKFRLYAVSTRDPQKLATEVSMSLLQQGVYEVNWGVHSIRVIVTSQVPEIQRNALWLLFSALPEKVHYGAGNYNWQRQRDEILLREIYKIYIKEGAFMAYTYEDFKRDIKKEWLEELTVDERLEGISHEELLKRISHEELLKRISHEELLKRISHEELLKRISHEELLKRISVDEIEAYLKQLKKSKH